MSDFRAIETRFREANTDDERTRALLASEQVASEELVDFLMTIARDVRVFDLTRIEAINALGLSARRVPSRAGVAINVLIGLACDDPDDDIRNYSLMALEFHAHGFDPARIALTIQPGRYSNTRYSALAVLERQLSSENEGTAAAARAMLAPLTTDSEIGDDVRDLLDL